VTHGYLSAHGLRSSNEPSRRGFLITMMGAGRHAGIRAIEPRRRAAGSAGELFEPTIWYGIDPSGTVTINIIRAEMGQHVGTALGRIVAEELEADWNKVKIVTVDSDPKWGTDDHGRQLVGVAEFPDCSAAPAPRAGSLWSRKAPSCSAFLRKCARRARRGARQRKVDSVRRYRRARRSEANLHAGTIAKIFRSRRRTSAV
jgi:isoquinoline 1-oxidoreductase beta subunit